MTTIVSCFYLLESHKYTNELYDKWLNNFFQIRNNIVIFTNKFTRPYLEQKIKENRKKNLTIIDKEFVNFKTYKYLDQFKKQYETLENEKYHNIFLYLIWNEKINFVKEAIEKNYFNSEYFLYCDACYFRNKIYKTWPNQEKINKLPKDKVTYFLIIPFTDEELQINQYENLPSFDYGRNKHQAGARFAGGIFVSHKNFYLKWFETFYEFLEKFSRENKFIGKDQSIINSIYLIEPKLINAIKFDIPYSSKKSWFLPQGYLS